MILSLHKPETTVKERHPYKDPAILERYLTAMRKAGMK
jgi:hypothetical protein